MNNIEIFLETGNIKDLNQEDKTFLDRLTSCYTREKNNVALENKIYGHDDYLVPKMKMGDGSTLTDEQKRAIEEYWSRYSFALKNDIRIQECYTNASGIFSPKYMSEGFQWNYMWRFTEDLKYRDSFHDKNYFDLLTPGVKHPTVVIRKIKGLYYNASRELISLEVAAQICYNYVRKNKSGKVIVKPSAGGGGYGIEFIRKEHSLDKAISILNKNPEVIVEDILEAHDSYSVFHPQSLNTLRVVSLFYNNEVTIISALLRTGRNAFELDNYSQGGVSIGIYPNGVLHEYGFDMYCNKFYAHPDTGVEFKGYKLYGFGKVINEIKRLHPLLPQFKHVSWDFAVGKDGQPILMEFNTRGDVTIIQQNGDLPYGKYTDEIFDDWLLYSFYRAHATKEYDYKEYADKIVLIKCFSRENTIIIPDTFLGKRVVGIENGCFVGCSAEKIVLPQSIGYVDEGAFGKITKEIVYPENYLARPVITMARINEEKKCVEIKWNPVKDADSYIISRETNRVQEVLAVVSSTEYRDVSFSSIASSCRYSIAAQNKSTGKVGEAMRSGRVRLTPFNKVKITKAGYLKKINKVKICWEPKKGVDLYYVTRTCEGETDVLGATKETEFLDGSIDRNKKYFYEIYPNSLDDLNSARTTTIMTIDQ